MKLYIQLLFILAINFSVAQQFETNSTIALTGITYGEAVWINMDNNPKKEVFISGYDNNYDSFSGVFSFQETNSGLLPNAPEAYNNSNIQRVDFNYDGLIDVILNGNNSNDDIQVKLLTNNGDGSFSEEIIPIEGTNTGQMAIADLNNDNRNDIIITGVSTGSDYVAKLYLQNGSGDFTEQATNLFGNSFGDILVFDANNDGNNDVLITGYNNSYSPDTKLYLNDGNANFTENTTANIMGIYFSDTNAADYDNDGDLDLIISGFDTSYTPFSALYNNDGNGNFTQNSQISLMPLYWGAADFVDYDNDGDLDIFLTGADAAASPHAKFYKNTNGNFTEDTDSSNVISGTYISSSDWSDYDNDGDLDLILTGLNGSGDASAVVYNNRQNSLSTPSFTSIDKLSLYPNPVSNGILNINTNANNIAEVFEINIFSTDGKRVLTRKQQLDKAVNVSELQQGVYMLQLNNGQQTVSKKLIIN